MTDFEAWNINGFLAIGVICNGLIMKHIYSLLSSFSLLNWVQLIIDKKPLTTGIVYKKGLARGDAWFKKLTTGIVYKKGLDRGDAWFKSFIKYNPCS